MILKPQVSDNKIGVLPLIPLRNVVPFPHVELSLVFGRPRTTAALNAAAQGQKKVILVAQKRPELDVIGWDEIYHLGVLAEIRQVFQADGTLHAVVQGLRRVAILGLVKERGFDQAKFVELGERIDNNPGVKLKAAHLARELRRAFSLGKGLEPLFMLKLTSGLPLPELLDQASFALDASVAEKQQLLETLSWQQRLDLLIDLLGREIQVLQLEQKIEKKTRSRFEEHMKKTVLEEKKKTIENELKSLGIESKGNALSELRQKLKKAGLPVAVQKKANYELKRLQQMPSFAPEASYIRTYLETLASLPWRLAKQKAISLKKAARILNRDHYGLREVKSRILEYLAVMELRKKQKKEKDAKGPTNILCFIGPPGVGKTSLGQSIARALGRKFVRVSLGGIRDEAEIKGHRRTYVGAMPGRIIQGIRTAGVKNPVFMLDEVDKIGTDFRGDPAAALLEVLDPEQNKNFSDHYLEVPYDLSDVFFILTGNIVDTIPAALRDRLEIIYFSSYTAEEKLQIAKRYLVPKQLKNHGLEKYKVHFGDDALQLIIQDYTYEAGVRNLERAIAKICRRLARRIAEKKPYPHEITKATIRRFLGPKEYNHTLRERHSEMGVATGLAWTRAGGEILFVEVALMPGDGKIYLTGKLGEVMQESARAALSYIRSHWEELKVPKNFFKNLDVHIHVPEGAVPKDGPSAGVTIATALLSALTKKKVRADVGMTGEITLRGKVLEIGGVKEKVLAAHRAGLRTIVLPKANKKDVAKIPARVKKALKFIFVDNLDQVFQAAFKGQSK